MNSSEDKKPSDSQMQTNETLLHQFVEEGDQSALRLLLEKHSALVMSVCQQVLRNRHDAEEAFQETFLKLVNKATTIQSFGSLSSWLYRVAYREAIALKRKQNRNSSELMNEEPAVASEQDDPLEFDELNILHQELNELEEKYRGPIVLCYLEGKSQKEAAQELNLTLASLKASVNSGRERLRKRLLRRGICITSVLALWQVAQASNVTWATTAVIQKTMASCMANSATLSAGSISISSMPVSNSALSKGTIWMVISTGKKIVGSIVIGLIILGGSLLMVLRDNEPQKKIGATQATITKFAVNNLKPDVVEISAELQKIIDQLKENELLYQNIDVTMEINWKNYNPFKTSKNDVYIKSEKKELVHFISQGNYYRIDVQADLLKAKGKTEFNTSTIAYGGMSTRFFNHRNTETSNMEGRIVPGKELLTTYYRPHNLLMYLLHFNTPLSKFLSGDQKHLENYPEKLKRDAVIKCSYLGQELFNELNCHKISHTTYIATKPHSRIILWLAVERNFIPLKAEFSSFQNPNETSVATADVTKWMKLKSGDWFPQIITTSVPNGQTPNQVEKTSPTLKSSINHTVLKASLSPAYDQSYFQDNIFPEGTLVKETNENGGIANSYTVEPAPDK